MTANRSTIETHHSSGEYVIGDSELLVLVSDRASNFIYANPAYCRASGYSLEELKGTLTRKMLHPDLPPQVVDDMTLTLMGKQPWTGIIKNQRKNGDHYWLRLNISPIYANGNQYAGALMVHSKVSRAEIAEFDALYKLMRTGANRNLTVHHGKRFRLNLWGKLVLSARKLGLNGLVWGTTVVAALGGTVAIAAVSRGASVWIGLAGFLSVATVLGAYLSSELVRPLRKAVRFANDIAAGSLGGQMQSTRSDEIGGIVRALSQMNVNMRATVADVRDGVSLMRQATGNIATGTSELADRTDHQGRRLQATAASTEEMTANVKQTADASRKASDCAVAANVAAEASGRAIAEVTAAMNAITGASKKIADIVGVIDSIAFQTNILALNAAVEAARAGEQGRGFAVVASEVRSLAQRSAQSAREIRTLIFDSAKHVDEGTTRVAGAGKAVNDVMTQMRGVTNLVASIAHALIEQEAGIGQINDSVANLEHVTEQNANLVNEHTASATSLREQAERLAEAVSVFKLSSQENQQLFNSAQDGDQAIRKRALAARAAA
jgi:aerotaxis receptor